MNIVIYWLARSVIALIQALPIRIVARLGRAGGGLAFFLTARYRHVTLDNLTQAFPEKSAPEIREIAKENFRRIGENYASAIKTAAMTPLQMPRTLNLPAPKKSWFSKIMTVHKAASLPLATLATSSFTRGSANSFLSSNVRQRIAA